MRWLFVVLSFLASFLFARPYVVTRLASVRSSGCTLSCDSGSELPSDKAKDNDVEKYILRAQILEEALLVMRDRFESQTGSLNTVQADDTKKLESMLADSEAKRRNLELSLNEAEEDFDRFQKRTDILEKTLSKSREKVQELESRMKEVEKAKRDAETDLKEVSMDNERLVLRLGKYERELVNARNARNGVRQRDSVEIMRLKEELAVAHALARSLETEYSTKISDLEAFIETAKRSELVEREQLEMLVQSAQAEAADLRVTVERNEKLIAELELGVRGSTSAPSSPSTVPVSIEVLEQKLAQTTQLLESTIMLLSQATEDSRKRVQDRVQERVGNQAADYLIAGDLRDQRRILESQAELMERMLIQMEAMFDYGEGKGQSRRYSQSQSQSQSQSPSGSIERGRTESETSRSSRQLSEGSGVSIPGVATIKRTSKRALHGVKRGLGFLVGLEVAPFQSEGLVIDTQLEESWVAGDV